MESLGGPFLLIENMRNANAATAAAAANASPPAPPVSNKLIHEYGAEYPPELGLTREKSIQLDPVKFYRHVIIMLSRVYWNCMNLNRYDCWISYLRSIRVGKKI